jgi:hypothetical protein
LRNAHGCRQMRSKEKPERAGIFLVALAKQTTGISSISRISGWR